MRRAGLEADDGKAAEKERETEAENTLGSFLGILYL
jgi:hypothetical protein